MTDTTNQDNPQNKKEGSIDAGKERENADTNTPANQNASDKVLPEDKPSEQKDTTESTAAQIVDEKPEPKSEDEKPILNKTSEANKAQKAKPEKNSKPHVEKTSPKPMKKSKPWAITALFLICFILAGSLVGVSYYAWQLLDEQKQNLNTVVAQITANGATNTNNAKSIEQIKTTQNREKTTLQNSLKQAQRQIKDLENRMRAQAKRLSAMSDTSREDWLLAEAEYLLKLANQRVRIERSAEGSDALLVEADAILRDLDSPDLYSLRAAIAEDLASLRLMNKIDVEGIYLSLVALANHIEKLPVRSARMEEGDESTHAPTQAQSTQALQENNAQELSVTEKVGASFQRFVDGFHSAYRITYSEAPKPLQRPSDVHYLKQNLRLILERAQLALLREQQDIYEQSLTQADALIVQYFDINTPTTNFRNELQRLAKKTIVQNLPDISNSLELLHEYIENLHNLKGVKPAPAKKASAANTSVNTSVSEKLAQESF